MQQPNKTEMSQDQLIKIMWLFFFGSLGIFVVGAYFILQNKGAEFVFRAEEMFNPAFIGVSLFCILLMWASYSRLPKAMNDPEGKGLIVKLIQYWSADTAGALGLALASLYANFTYMAALTGLAVIGLVIFYPRK